MSKSFNFRLIKANRVYSVKDLSALLGCSKNTVSNWVAQGLEQSDREKPYVFRGEALLRFDQSRKDRFKTGKGATGSGLNAGEFRCFGCKTAVRPEVRDIIRKDQNGGRMMLQAPCPECARPFVFKFASGADLALLDGKPYPNTPSDCAHEDKVSVRGRVGKSPSSGEPPLHRKNDRLIERWQYFAAKHSDKTQARHLTAIRAFEVHIGGKRFKDLTVEAVSSFRVTCPPSLRHS